MQTREITLKELDTVYELIKELYNWLEYDEFENLIYDMREINYKMLGVFEKGELISFAGVAILTTLKDKRHLRVFDFITKNKEQNKKYDKLMKEYVEDYAKIAMCLKIIY